MTSNNRAGGISERTSESTFAWNLGVLNWQVTRAAVHGVAESEMTEQLNNNKALIFTLTLASFTGE